MVTYANRILLNHRFGGSHDRALSGKDLDHPSLVPLTQHDEDVR